MKNRMILLSLVVMLAMSAMAAEPPENVPSHNATAAFARLKSLVGSWEGETPMGKVREQYELASDGHVLLEHTAIEGLHENMITTYYLDGDKLVLTHYCSLGNQPRMQAQHIDLASGSIALVLLAPGTWQASRTSTCIRPISSWLTMTITQATGHYLRTANHPNKFPCNTRA